MTKDEAMTQAEMTENISEAKDIQAAVETAQTDDVEQGKSPKTSCFDRFSNHRAHAYLALIARLYLAYVFLDACMHKILDPAAFALDIASYQIMPLELINAMAILLPWVELAVAILLIIGYRVRASALLVSGMMVMFMIALGIALYRGYDISCGCFASDSLEASDPITMLTMLRDAAWLSLSLYVLVFDRRPLGLDGYLLRRKEKKHENA